MECISCRGLTTTRGSGDGKGSLSLPVPLWLLYIVMLLDIWAACGWGPMWLSSDIFHVESKREIVPEVPSANVGLNVIGFLGNSGASSHPFASDESKSVLAGGTGTVENVLLIVWWLLLCAVEEIHFDPFFSGMLTLAKTENACTFPEFWCRVFKLLLLTGELCSTGTVSGAGINEWERVVRVCTVFVLLSVPLFVV